MVVESLNEKPFIWKYSLHNHHLGNTSTVTIYGFLTGYCGYFMKYYEAGMLAFEVNNLTGFEIKLLPLTWNHRPLGCNVTRQMRNCINSVNNYNKLFLKPDAVQTNIQGSSNHSSSAIQIPLRTCSTSCPQLLLQFWPLCILMHQSPTPNMPEATLPYLFYLAAEQDFLTSKQAFAD